MVQLIPQELTHLIALNIEFNILICILCKFAIASSAIIRHFRDQHKTNIQLRKQVNEYIRGFPFVYDHTAIILPSDRSVPQSIIPIVNRFQYLQEPE